MSDELDLDAWRQKLLDLKEELLALERETEDNSNTVELDQQRMGRLSRMDALQGQQMAQGLGAPPQRHDHSHRGARCAALKTVTTAPVLSAAKTSTQPASTSTRLTATRCIDCVNQ